MKRTIFFTLIGATALICSESYADSYKYTPYIGASYSFAKTHAKGAKPSYNVGGIFVGSDYGKYFGTELFFNQTDYDNHYINDVKTRTSYRSYGLDLMAYLPLDCDSRFDLIATAGVGEYVFAQKIKGEKHHNDSGWGYRFGGGLKYSINSNWQLRGIARYVSFDRISDFDHQIEYSAGIEYHF